MNEKENFRRSREEMKVLRDEIMNRRNNGEKVIVTCADLIISNFTYYYVLRNYRYCKRASKTSWDKEEIEKLLSLYEKGITQKKIAIILNRSLGSVHAKIKYMAVKNKSIEKMDMRKKWTDEEKEKVKNYLETDKLSVKQISESMQRSYHSVYCIIKKIT